MSILYTSSLSRPTLRIGLLQQLMLCICLVTLSACAFQPQEKNYSIPFENHGPNVSDEVQNQTSYTLHPHDTLDVMFHFNTVQNELYQILPHDKLNIKFLSVPEYNGEYQVRPDGYISLPLVGDYNVNKQTVAELQNNLSHRYKSILKRPEFFVTLTDYQVHLRQIRESLEHPSMGLARLLTVRDDYKITMPYIGEITVDDKTLELITEEVNKLYSENIPGLSVDVLLRESSPKEIYVFGEVKNPGKHIVRGDISIIKAMALAGGPNIKANLDSVVTFTKKEDAMVAQLNNFYDQLKGKEPISMMHSDDILFVPESRLSATAQTIQYISEILLFQGIDLGYSYMLN